MHTISIDMKSIAVAYGIGKSEQDTLLWLSGKRQQWLILFDNADDPKVNLGNYFPKCSHGNILITSRNRAIRNHAAAPQSSSNISRLSLDDAKALLLRVACIPDERETLVTSIVEVC